MGQPAMTHQQVMKCRRFDAMIDYVNSIKARIEILTPENSESLKAEMEQKFRELDAFLR